MPAACAFGGPREGEPQGEAPNEDGRTAADCTGKDDLCRTERWVCRVVAGRLALGALGEELLAEPGQEAGARSGVPRKRGVWPWRAVALCRGAGVGGGGGQRSITVSDTDSDCFQSLFSDFFTDFSGVFSIWI